MTPDGILGLGALGAALLVGLRAVGDRIRGIMPGPGSGPPYAPAVAVDLDALYHQYGVLYSIDWRILKAIAQIESGEDPGAVNPADPSYGLGQVLCVADSPTEHCRNELPAVPEFKDATPRKLLDPEFNVRIFAQIIRWNLQHYNGDLERAVVAFNNWNAGEAGRGPDGQFYGSGNPQRYLDRFREAYGALTSRSYVAT